MNPDHSAYLGLSDETHKKNVRTIHVNAQVTAVTTILEFLGNCVNGVIFMVLDGFPEFMSSALFMQLHLISLSYVFLMNTRYNKNRIIEYGWKNVLKNIISCGKDRSTTSVAPSIQETQLRILPPNPRKYKDKYTNRSKSLVRTLKSKKDTNNHIVRRRKSIFIISNSSTNSTFDSETEIKIENGECISTQFDPQPCSSKDIEIQIATITDENVENSNLRKSMDCIRSKLLSAMLLQLNDEDAYINEFVKLVEYEEQYKMGQDVSKLSCKTDEVRVSDLTNFNGTTAQRKFEMRKAMLDNLICSKKDNDKVYDECFEQLVNMEENFIEMNII